MKKFYLVCLTFVIALACFAPTCAAQGLAERRAIKSYEDGTFKDLHQQITAAAGFEVPVNVEWEKIALPGQSENYSQDGFWTNIYFKPLIEALKEVTKDDMGKTALKEKLKEITVTFDEETAPSSNYAKGITFDGGKLTVNFKPWSNADDIEQRKTAMQKMIEEKL